MATCVLLVADVLSCEGDDDVSNNVRVKISVSVIMPPSEVAGESGKSVVVGEVDSSPVLSLEIASELEDDSTGERVILGDRGVGVLPGSVTKPVASVGSLGTVKVLDPTLRLVEDKLTTSLDLLDAEVALPPGIIVVVTVTVSGAFKFEHRLDTTNPWNIAESRVPSATSCRPSHASTVKF